MGGAWTPDRVDLLRKLATQNLSANDIGYELGVSRNAIIGKCGRMKINLPQARSGARPNGGRPRAPVPKRRVPWRPTNTAAPKPLQPIAAPPASDAEIPLAQRRTFMQLTEDSCRWPIGDVGDPGFFFCGGPSLTGQPYCTRHTKISCQPNYTHVRRNIRLF